MKAAPAHLAKSPPSEEGRPAQKQRADLSGSPVEAEDNEDFLTARVSEASAPSGVRYRPPSLMQLTVMLRDHERKKVRLQETHQAYLNVIERKYKFFEVHGTKLHKEKVMMDFERADELAMCVTEEGAAVGDKIVQLQRLIGECATQARAGSSSGAFCGVEEQRSSFGKEGWSEGKTRKATRHEPAKSAKYVPGIGRLVAKESDEDMAKIYDIEVEDWVPGVTWKKEERVPQNYIHCEGGSGANGLRCYEIAAIVRENVDEPCTVNFCRSCWEMHLETGCRTPFATVGRIR